MLVPSIFNDNFADDFFNDFFDVPSTRTAQRWLPNTSTMMQTDIKDKGDAFELGIALPGYQKEDMTVELKDGYLTVNAEHKENKEEKDKNGTYIRRERYTGHCSRSFYVGEDVKQEDIKAKYENGVLTLDIPKQPEKPPVEEKKFIAIEG